MEREEAKHLLELSRPGIDEERLDPALAEAFAMLETDAELKAWFDEQQELDTRISDHINDTKAPFELKNMILAGMHLHKANSTNTESEEAVPSPTTAPTQSRAWWLNPWTGIAALFVIMMVVMALPSNQASATQVADADLPPVIQYISKEIDALKAWQFDKRAQDPTELQTFLASANAPTPSSIPQGLDTMPSIGCITFDYGDGAQLSMICFKDDQVYHLITADKATYPDEIPNEPILYQCEDKAYKLWADEDQVKILTIHGSKEEMPEFI